MRRRLAAIGTLAVGLSAVSLPAQQVTQRTFRGGVDVVFVPVSVSERNKPVTGLASEDFVLTDNGVPQEIASTSIEALPVDVTLVLDTSGSVRGPALTRFKADLQAVAESLQLNDRLRLVTFATDVSDLFGQQPGGAPLPLDGLTAGGATSFYNALAAVLMAVPSTERPQLVFAFSDGYDDMSFLGAPDVVELARHSSACLYLALVRPLLIGPNQLSTVSLTALAPYAGLPDRTLLRDAAEQTGGRVYENLSSTELPATFRRVLDEFRTSYVLRYTPRGIPLDGWHELAVTVKGHDYTIRARRGYDGEGAR